MQSNRLVNNKETLLKADDDGVYTLSFLLLPDYSMASLLSAIEPLRIANRLADKTVFRWQCLSQNGDPVVASNGLALQEHLDIKTSPAPRNLFVNASFHPEKYCSDVCVNWLRGLNRQSCVLGALDTGCYLLAKAKLMDTYRMTLHWEAKPAFQERYPRLDVSDELFEIDARRITCAGGTAATDLMLHLIGAYFDAEFALLVCEQLIKSGARSQSDHQRISSSKRLKLYHPKLLKALELMGEHIETPLSASELAKALSVSMRQLERLFLQHLNSSPSHYYLQLRIERARCLLADSGLSIAEIALACGFSSTAHFSRRYRECYGITASQYRSQIQ